MMHLKPTDRPAIQCPEREGNEVLACASYPHRALRRFALLAISGAFSTVGCSSEPTNVLPEMPSRTVSAQQVIVKFKGEMTALAGPDCGTAYLVKAGEMQGLQVRFQRQIFSAAYVMQVEAPVTATGSDSKIGRWLAFLTRQIEVEYAEVDGQLRATSQNSAAPSAAASASKGANPLLTPACVDLIKGLEKRS